MYYTFLSYNVSPSLSIEQRMLCRLIWPAVLLHLAGPKMADKHDRDSSSETESDSGDRNDVKMQEMPLERNYCKFVPRLKVIQVTEMMSKCRKCHLRETTCKFAKFPGEGGLFTQTPLEACAFGAKNFPSKEVGISEIVTNSITCIMKMTAVK